MKQPSRSVSILCDFDGTISTVDLSDFIYSNFAACGLKFSDQWALGLISTSQEILQTFATVSAGRSEIGAALETIAIDPGFHDLKALAEDNDIELAVVSDGLDWAIQTVLQANGVNGVPIFANHVVISGERISFEFPWYDPSTPLAGVCKPLIVKRFLNKGDLVVYVGDGRSDHDAVHEANVVFAKGPLVGFCREQGIAAHEYENLSQVCEMLTPLLAEWKKPPSLASAQPGEGSIEP